MPDDRRALPIINDTTPKVGGVQDPYFTLMRGPQGGTKNLVQDGYIVRRLTPVECERLQGFPDGWTDIPYKGKEHPAEGPRYKAMGNSMAVPVMRWIGERMMLVDEIVQEMEKTP